MAGLNAAAATINAKAAAEKASKYVTDVNITAATRRVLATMHGAGNGIPTGVNGQTIVISPNVRCDRRRPRRRDRLGLHERDRHDRHGQAVLAMPRRHPAAKYAPSECR